MKNSLACIVFSIALFGCSRENPKTVPQPSGTADYWTLPSSAVVVKVNEYGLTKGANERRIVLQVALARAARQKFDKRKEDAFRFKLLRESEFAYVRDVLLTDWGKTNSVILADKELLDGRNRFTRNLTRGKMSYEVLKSRVSGVESAEIDEFVDRATYVGFCIDKITQANQEPIAADELRKRRQSQIAYNRRAVATNQLVWAAASNLWKQVQTDATAFDREVAKYQEHEAEHVFSDPDMGEIPLSFFDDDPVWKERLEKASEGDVLPPRIGDNGVLMVKVLQLIPISAQQNGKEPRWRLAKIFWELAAEWEHQTDEELLNDLKTFHLKSARERGMKKILSSATITYPSGTNLLRRVRGTRKLTPDDDRIPVKVRQRIENGDYR